MRRIATIGHSNRSLDDFVEALVAYNVAMVIDVRRYPRSRYNPQFNREALAGQPAAGGLGYEHLAELGGRREPEAHIDPSLNAGWTEPAFHHYANYALTPPFAAGFERLSALTETRHCAVMCAERDWQRCHRQIIADYLIVLGWEVRHIVDQAASEPARISPLARPYRRTAIHYPCTELQLAFRL